MLKTFLTQGSPVRLQAFRILIGVSLFAYLLFRWHYAPEWLTDEGFHPSAAVKSIEDLPFVPLLPSQFLGAFGILLFASSVAFIVGWGGRIATAVLFLAFAYVTFADPVSSFTLNKLYLFVLFLFLWCPHAAYQPPWQKNSPTISYWPILVLQSTLVLVYVLSGWRKAVYGDWLDWSDVLWTQVQGPYATWMVSLAIFYLPKWVWTILQWSALLFELSSPLLFFVRELRVYGLLFGFIFSRHHCRPDDESHLFFA